MARRRNKKTQFLEAAALNTTTYNCWEDYLQELAICRYIWDGLPNSVDPRMLELCLCGEGAAVIFTDEVLGALLVARVAQSGTWDIYDTPIEYTAYACNHYHQELNNLNSVLIFNNYLRTSDFPVAELYAKRLAEIDRTIDVNVIAQKTPVLITGTDQQRLTLENLYMQYSGNYPFIFGNKDAGIDQLGVLSTNAAYVADKLTNLKHQYINEYLTRIGVENSNSDKKERLVADEVASNYGSVEMSRRSGLMTRQRAANIINNMFGLNVSVHFNSQLATLVNAAFMPAQDGLITADIEEREENEQVYNPTKVDNRNTSAG